jgi:hypothetical protein
MHSNSNWERDTNYALRVGMPEPARSSLLEGRCCRMSGVLIKSRVAYRASSQFPIERAGVGSPLIPLVNGRSSSSLCLPDCGPVVT